MTVLTVEACEHHALTTQRHVYVGSDGSRLQVDKRALADVCEQLRRCPVGLDPLLSKTVPQGVAYHHAGMYHHAGVITSPQEVAYQLCCRLLACCTT